MQRRLLHRIGAWYDSGMPTSRRLTTGLGFCALTFLAACHGGRERFPSAGSPDDFPIQWQTQGTYSNIARPIRVVARDAVTLAQLPIAEIPVDFQKQMVLVAALGPATSDQVGIRIGRVWKEGSRIRVQVNTLHPGDDKRGGLMRTSPYHIVVIPRSNLNVEGFSSRVPRGAFAAPAPAGAYTPPKRR